MKDDIFEALHDWNPWLTGDFPMALKGFDRDYHLLDYLKIPEIKIIEGARRVGKSTLLYQVIYEVTRKKNHPVLYINFEDEILKKYALSDIVYAYLEKNSIDYLFLDEIQNCIDWVPFIRKIYDRQKIKQIWVSGSNSSLIKQEYATLLTGRNIALHIQALSFNEFLAFKAISHRTLPASKKQQIILMNAFSEYMSYGAFPAVVRRDVLKKEILLAYFDDFIYKDIVARHQVNPDKIKELAIYLASNTTKIVSYRKLAAALNCHANTVIDYLSYLKQVFLFDEVYKFDYALKKQFSNEKKIYCIDTGLAAAVSFRFSEEKGRMLENVVYNALGKEQQSIYFHKQQFECDFVTKKGCDITQAIQVCHSLLNKDTKKREFNGLIEAMTLYKLKSGLLLTLDEEGEEAVTYQGNDYTIHILPVWKWLIGLL